MYICLFIYLCIMYTYRYRYIYIYIYTYIYIYIHVFYAYSRGVHRRHVPDVDAKVVGDDLRAGARPIRGVQCGTPNLPTNIIPTKIA